ncbi:MAG: peptidoglycan-associated lipoprotein Pal, partial [Desulfohalobiaceae bacterium]
EAERKAAEREALIEKVSTDIAEPVYFAFDSFEISQEARGKLERKANVLKQHQDLSLVIEGHCDERGTEEYNLALGERRARAAYEYLILLGVDSGRMQIISYGEERPADTDSNEAAWSRNRRCEFKVY